MLTDILNAANLYADGVKHVQDRRDKWLKKHVELKDRLKEIADHLNANAAYKQGFFVDINHAYDEKINGTSAAMPSVTFRSGQMPMLVLFRNNMGEKMDYMEDGFHITFTPTITGQLVVFLIPHQNELNKNPPQYGTLAVVDDPAELTIEVVDDMIAKGIQMAFYSSFTGIAEQPESNGQEPPHAQSPIGFRLHETTEKVH